MSDASSNDKARPARQVPWHPSLGVLVVLSLYLIGPLLAGTLVGYGLSLGGWATEGTTAQFLYILVIEALTFAGLLWFLRSRNSSLAAIGFGRPKLKHFGIGLAVYPIYFLAFLVIVVGTTALFPDLKVDQEQQLGFDNVQGIIALTLTFVSLVVLPPLLEELTVRGLLFTSLRSRLGLSMSIAITSLLFASAHLPAGGAEDRCTLRRSTPSRCR